MSKGNPVFALTPRAVKSSLVLRDKIVFLVYKTHTLAKTLVPDSVTISGGENLTVCCE